VTEQRKIGAIQRRLIPSYIFLILFALFSVFPLFWMLTAATNTTVDVSQGSLWFGSFAGENFKTLLDGAPFFESTLWSAMKNSFIYAAVQTVVCLFICSLAGYGFELYHEPAKDALFGVLLMAMMIPSVATMIPLFTMMSKMKLLSSVWGFILPAVATPFMIMMFRQNSRNFPVEIMNAARIDGLNEFGIFFKIYMPVMKSTYAAAAVITFMNSWNAYLWPRVVLKDPNSQTMPLYIANLAAGYTIDYGALMMSVLFCSLPTIIIFFILQKQFAQGITGAVK
jgi:lactose/L-arabinose transport system permease protein